MTKKTCNNYYHQNLAGLAQLVEHSPCKRTVVGSSPTAGSIHFKGFQQ